MTAVAGFAHHLVAQDTWLGDPEDELSQILRPIIMADMASSCNPVQAATHAAYQEARE